jgi:hypothetical protein
MVLLQLYSVSTEKKTKVWIHDTRVEKKKKCTCIIPVCYREDRQKRGFRPTCSLNVAMVRGTCIHGHDWRLEGALLSIIE